MADCVLCEPGQECYICWDARRDQELAEALELYRRAAGQVLEAKRVIAVLAGPAERERPTLVKALREQHPGLFEG